MNSVKRVVLPAVFIALLIGGQLALSMVSGVEIVTVLLLSFCYRYGVKQGLLVATGFSLLRCFVFGFYPGVVILYLVYYNLFALLFGTLGKTFRGEYSVGKHAVVLISAVIMTVFFTLLDDVITPLLYGFSFRAAKTYFFSSLYAVVPQTVCAFVTTLLLFPVLIKIMR